MTRGPLLVLLLLALGCARGSFSEGKERAGAAPVLRYAIHTTPTTLDPHIVQDVDTGELLASVYEGLVSYDAQNRLKGGLAEAWTVSPDGKTYTFQLREAKFHDGRPVTAEDVVASYARATNPKLNSPTAESYLSDVAAMRAVDPKTVEVRLKQPAPYFLGKLTYPCAFVLPKGTPPAEIKTVKGSVGTGPFRLSAYEPDQQVTLLPFDHYDGKPTLARVERPVIKDAATRLNGFRAGDLHLLTLERQDLAGVQKDATLKGQLRSLPRPAIYYLGLNTRAYAPFRDVRVRRAFALAIDRERLARERIGLPVAQSFVPPGLPGHREGLPPIPFDPKEARRLLAEAGYPGGKGLPPLTLYYRAERPDSQTLAVTAVSDLQRNLGVSLDSRAMEWRTFLERRNAGELPLYGASWYADYLDPQNFLSFLFRSQAKQNYEGYRNPEFDRLVARADTISDEAERLRLYAQAEGLLRRDLPRVPAYFGQDELLVSPRVKGLETNLFGVLPPAKVTLGAKP